MKFDIQKKLQQLSFLFNYLKKLKFNQAQPGVGLIVLAVGVLLLSLMLYRYNRLTITSQDHYASVTLSRSQFTDQIAHKNSLVPKLLPELSTQYITLLATDKKQTQLIYAYALPAAQMKVGVDPVVLAEQLKNHLIKQTELKNIQVEVLDREKKQIRFSATNVTAKTYYQESCLLTVGQLTLLSVCARLQGEASSKQAQQLIGSVKINKNFK